jgi:hypothetical protein
MDQKRVKELLSEEAFVKSLVSLETPEQVQAAFKAKGVDVTVDEVKALGEAVKQSASGDVSDADLEKVAGGFTGQDIATIMGALPPGAIDSIGDALRRQGW